MTKSVHALSALLAASLLAAPAVHADEPATTVTGHIDLVSRYVLRGATSTYNNFKGGFGNTGADAPESRRPVLQWGADVNYASGWYLGYFGSQINYSYKQLGQSYDSYVAGQAAPADFQHDRSIENDVYGGYNGKIGELGYTAGVTGYYYINGKHANAFETKFGLSYGAFSANAQTLLNDTVWGNRGDTYWTLNYTRPLPYDITFTSSLGAYTYKKEGKYLGTIDPLTGASCDATLGQSGAFSVGGCLAGDKPVASGFRHLILGITQPIGQTGLTWGLQGIIGGDNRFGIQQGSRVVGSLSYGF